MLFYKIEKALRLETCQRFISTISNTEVILAVDQFSIGLTRNQSALYHLLLVYIKHHFGVICHYCFAQYFSYMNLSFSARCYL